VEEKRNTDKISYLRFSKSDVERKLTEHAQHIPEYVEGIKKDRLSSKDSPVRLPGIFYYGQPLALVL